ncbi:MAG: hypothetical protein ABIV50_14460 [Opitutus sp.]
MATPLPVKSPKQKTSADIRIRQIESCIAMGLPDVAAYRLLTIGARSSCADDVDRLWQKLNRRSIQ